MRALGRRGSVRNLSSRELPWRIDTISPSGVVAGAGATPVDINGGPFPASPQLYIDGVLVSSTRISAVLIQATVASGTTDVPGFHSFQVKDALGRASNIVQWPVSFPVPTFSAHSPTFGYVGEGGVAVSSTGTGFYDPGTDATVDGSDVVTSVSSPTAATVNVPGSVVDVAGDHPIVMTNPLPGGGSSSSRTFQGRYRAPTLASLSPTGATLGAGNVTVTATVTNAYDAAAWAGGGSTIAIDGTPVATTWLDATHVRFVVPSSVTAVGGAKAITISNPTAGGGGGTSSSVNFNVGFLAPTISSLDAGSGRASITYSDPPTVVRVLGTNFYSGGNSVVNIGGVPQATTFINSGELRFTYSPSSVQDLSITVTNNTVGGGGGTSAAKTLSITPEVTAIAPNIGYQYDANGLPASVTTVGAIVGSVVSMNAAEVPTTRISSTQLDITIPGAVSTNLGNVAVRVRNATGGPDSQSSTTYFINAFNPLTDGTGAYASYDADHVTLDTTPGRLTDVVGIQDIVGGVGPFNNTVNVAQNPVLVAADSSLNNYASIDYNGTTDLSGTTTSAPFPPLVTTLFPASDWTVGVIFLPRTCTTNDSSLPYNNNQVFASDASPGVRCGLGLRTNGGSGLSGSTGLVEFWMFDGAFKKVSQAITFGNWAYVVIKKSGTTLSISVNGAAFTNTSGVGNMSATTQRVGMGGSYAGAPGGRKYFDGRFRAMIYANWTATDIMRFQNYSHYLLGIT